MRNSAGPEAREGDLGAGLTGQSWLGKTDGKPLAASATRLRAACAERRGNCGARSPDRKQASGTVLAACQARSPECKWQWARVLGRGCRLPAGESVLWAGPKCKARCSRTCLGAGPGNAPRSPPACRARQLRRPGEERLPWNMVCGRRAWS